MADPLVDTWLLRAALIQPSPSEVRLTHHRRLDKDFPLAVIVTIQGLKYYGHYVGHGIEKIAYLLTHRKQHSAEQPNPPGLQHTQFHGNVLKVTRYKHDEPEAFKALSHVSGVTPVLAASWI